jgi:hypothetical protein
MGWIETNGERPDDIDDHDYIWICWSDGSIELLEGWATAIDWADSTHWQEAFIDVPNPP